MAREESYIRLNWTTKAKLKAVQQESEAMGGKTKGATCNVAKMVDVIKNHEAPRELAGKGKG